MLENVDNLITHQKGQTFATIIDVLVNGLNYKVIGVVKDEQTGKLVYVPKILLGTQEISGFHKTDLEFT